MKAKILERLLAETWASPVFGDSFLPSASLKTSQVVAQIQAVADIFTQDLGKRIAPVEPNYKAVTAQIMPKTVSFCPALAAGELHRTEHLSAFAVAIGLMFWADQTMDRGDAAMPYAIELCAGQTPNIPKDQRKKAQAQAKVLHGIQQKITFYALPEDQSFVFDCFLAQVLVNEVWVHRKSQEYLQASDKELFLNTHGLELANRITIDAGFPSVSSSLHALYRHDNPRLPSLAKVYANQAMRELLQVCNVVVRLIDELGDHETDAGLHPDWGVFSINPFNQSNPVFVRELLRLGKIDNPKLMRAILQFSTNKTTTNFILTALLDHVTSYVSNLPAGQFDHYIRCCKRVLEIGYVNRAGDIAMGVN